MKTIRYPNKSKWDGLCERPSINSEKLTKEVSRIMTDVQIRGNEALIELGKKFDGVDISKMKLDLTDQDFAIDPELAEAIKTAEKNISTFHEAQREDSLKIETSTGVTCWRKSVPIQRVGLYIPGGSAPLFSTLLMLAIPAQLAGCQEIVVCTPAQKDKSSGKYFLNDTIGWTCKRLGINKVYLVGGAQAIAAMTYGTKTIPKVDKIFGPGNQYVTEAKQQSQMTGTAIDMPAGPSEVLVIADEAANAEFVAADLLSQAEHGPDSQVILVSDSERLIQQTDEEVKRQLEDLPRKEVASVALKSSKSILVKSLNEAMEFSNRYAPEHLIIATTNCEELSGTVISAGSVFLGKWSCESAGDYASGTNHTLPTNGYAASYSGVSLDSFIKKITFQQLTEKGLQHLGPTIEKMAEAEGLGAHKNAVTVRLNQLNHV